MSEKFYEEKTPIIDFHLHAKRKGKPIIDEILHEMDKEKIAKAVLLGRDTDPTDLDDPVKKTKIITSLIAAQHSDNVSAIIENIRGELSRSITNEETAAYIRTSPSRLIGVGSINLSKSEEYVASTLETIYTLNLIGIKFYPPTQFFNPTDSENLRFICDRLKKRKKILIFHTGVMPGIWESPILSIDANPQFLEPIATKYDSIPFVLAHFGAYSATFPGIWFNEALSLGKKCRNVWFDISAVPYVVTEKRMIEKAKSIVGIDRILYGSDYIDYIGFTLEAVKGTPYLTLEEKRQILGLNATKLLTLVNH